MPRSALLVGATGLIGQQCLQRLLNSPLYEQVVVLTRRPLSLEDGKLKVWLTAFDDLDQLGSLLEVDDVFCCLGTTRRKAGSKEAFEQVDYHMVVNVAQACVNAGAKNFLVVSAVGASTSALSFYSQVKGRMEKAVAALGFQSVYILRPSLLLGKRAEFRPMEDLAQRLSPATSFMWKGPLRIYRPVRAAEVAELLLNKAKSPEPGVHVLHMP